MHDWPPRRRRVRPNGRGVVPVTAVLIAAAVPCATADAQAVAPLGPALATKVNVVGDSVIVTDQPLGRATIQVTRPDAVTGKPVVIGTYSGSVDSSLPFTVNTTAPSAVSPNGDCWQAGALSQALTPDIRPGDTVTVTGEPGVLGGGAPSTAVTVPANGAGGTGGPIPSCGSVAPFAQNAATAGPQSVGGGPLAVSGVAQPLATGISSSVTDGAHSTAPVDVAPNPDGTWAAQVPAAQVGTLADGALTVNPVFAVPDVSTGAPAHIVGATIAVQKSGADRATGPGAPRPAAGGGPAAGGAGPATNRGTTRVMTLRLPSAISLVRARRDGLRASFVVPDGARVIGLRLVRGRRTVLRSVVPAGKAGTRQTVRLGGTALRPVLGRGRYTLAVSAGPSRDRLDPPVLSTIRVR